MSQSKPRVIIAPHFRRMDEIFDPPTIGRLSTFAEIIWGRDGPMRTAAFEREIRRASAVVFGTWCYGRNAIRFAGDDLRAIIEVAGGHSHQELDYGSCLERGIQLGSCAPVFGPVVAEMALALTLAATREIAAGDRAMRAGREEYVHAGNRTTTTLYGKTLGFVGCGGLTRSLVPLVTPFGPSLLGYDPWVDATELASRGIEPVSLEDLFDRSHVVYVMAVPSPDNEGLISRRLMERLAPTDVLVVASRAHLVDYDALRDLVGAGRFKAAVDVYPREPVDSADPLRRAEGIVHSAHRAGALPDALLQIGHAVVADLHAILADSPDRQLQYATAEQLTRLGRI